MTAHVVKDVLNRPAAQRCPGPSAAGNESDEAAAGREMPPDSIRILPPTARGSLESQSTPFPSTRETDEEGDEEEEEEEGDDSGSDTTDDDNIYFDRDPDTDTHNRPGGRPTSLDVPRRAPSSKEPSVITDLGHNVYEAWKPLRTQTSVSRPISYDGAQGRLQARLVNVVTRNTLKGRDMGFVPKQQLYDIMDVKGVADELRRIEQSFKKRVQFWKPTPSAVRIEEQARIICGQHTNNNTGDETTTKTAGGKSYQRIFAILLLIERPGKIWDFVDAGVCDADLPLSKVFGHKNNPKSFKLRRKSAEDTPLRCFHGWRRPTVARFEHWQWAVVAPFFSRSVRKKQVMHYAFPEETVLPFTYSEMVPHRGGYGQVSKVFIHPEHHNFYHHHKEEGMHETHTFAIKELHSDDEEDFKKEVRVLKRLSHTHAHLISLLATYKYRGKYHLIFHWAECDLRTYWETKTPTYDMATILWMARQCLGIGRGLSKVHRHETTTNSSLLLQAMRQDAEDANLLRHPGSSHSERPSTPGAEPSGRRHQQQKQQQQPRAAATGAAATATTTTTTTTNTPLLYGRHGDIKPSNLLWFPHPTDRSDKGTIKIADFGIAELSTKVSSPSTLDGNRLPSSPMYRPPECDLPGALIRNSYDIWTLGCLYLEFVTWFLGGQALLDAFREVRRITTSPRLSGGRVGEVDQNFFEIVGGGRARVKPCVVEFINTRLRSHPRCSPFLRDFLKLITTDMIIVEPRDYADRGKRRMTSSHLTRELGEMYDRCEGEPGYALVLEEAGGGG